MALRDDFKPSPTKITGGVERMIRCFERCRTENDDGYGSGVVQPIDGWTVPLKKVTSCSPFTATVIGMMFDPGGSDSANPFKPMYDGGKTPLPSDFYSLHNGNYFPSEEGRKALGQKRKEQFRKNGWSFDANESWGSIVFFNLGYEIDPRDMRRGDMVAIDWNSGHGHATFCWDVHLSDAGEVDCFQFVSSNGNMNPNRGPGVSVGCPAGRVALFVEQSGSKYKKKRDPLFADCPEYVQFGGWKALPHVTKGVIDKKTFKETPTSITYHAESWGIATVHVVRFFGVAPPTRAQNNPRYKEKFDLARQLAAGPPPESYAMGTAKPVTVHIENAPPTVVKAEAREKNPDATKAAPPRPVQQHPQRPVPHQHDVEHGLGELFAAGWIAKDPGDLKSLNDGQTQAAVKDFQEKFGLKVDGIAGPATRRELREQLMSLHRGEPKPHPHPPAPGHPSAQQKKPRVEHLYWVRNRAEPGDFNAIVLFGKNLDLVQTFKIFLKDQKTGREESLIFPLVAAMQRGTQLVKLPASFGPGSVVVARVEATSGDGTRLEKQSDVPLFIGPQPPPPPGPVLPPTTPPPGGSVWPWDESKWPQRMQRRLADLRATPPPGGGDFQRRQITHYYVKSAKQGETPVYDRNGGVIAKVDRDTLYKADIEGTLRIPDGRVLNVDDSHGTIYAPKMCPGKDGQMVKKMKPAGFDPVKSHWKDVTATEPWGSGAGGQGPLIPFRTLAHNPKERFGGKRLYGMKVYIKQLDGLVLPTGEKHNGICYVGDCGGMVPGEHFDFFVGTQDNDRALRLPGTCDVLILG